MKPIHLILLVAILSFVACKNAPEKNQMEAASQTSDSSATNLDTFEVSAESFADIQVLRYQVPEWSSLSLKEKELCYYLYEAALSGRDIIYDQKDKNGILLRKTLENIYDTYPDDKTNSDWLKFEEYCGRFWFSNGNHHHYGNEKFIPECDWNYFSKLMDKSNQSGFPLEPNESFEKFKNRVKPLLYDLSLNPKCVDLTSGIDNIKASSNNFYENVTQKEVEAFYEKMPSSGKAPSWGLNSKLIKENGKLVEKTWKASGMYGASISKIIHWLEKASLVAENEQQKKTLELLIRYYKSGDLKDFDLYCIEWVRDTISKIDVVNGFIEDYLDAIGKKASFESIVSIRDEEATKRIKAIANQAQWFEDHSPIDPKHKKQEVIGITAKAINAVVQSGDAAPASSIGINLPNSDWIRKDYGSKSVSLSNIIYSYNVMNAKKGTLDEFAANDEIKMRIKKYGALASDLHTDMHECIGHASGQINPGVQTTDKTLKNYASCLEEARADLVALYFIMSNKLVDIGVMPNLEVAKAEYDNYILNGLMTQLTRIKEGDNIEEAHMRNRQLISMWAYKMGMKDSVIVFDKYKGKTFVRIRDYNQLRLLFGRLLVEIQRIKSEGDYNAAKDLVETYGVQVDKQLHKEILIRFKTLQIKPYRGFIQPKLVPVYEADKLIDVKLEYPTSFYKQMMEYGKNYSFLGVNN